MSFKPTSPDMSDPSVAMFHGTAGANVAQNEFNTSGRNMVVNKSYNNLTIRVFPDVINYIKTAAQPFVSWTRMNQSTSADSREPDEVEISSMIPPNPSLLPVSSIADRYTRSMLECMVGYPLYEPEPFSQHSKELYACNGVNVGDVGFVREDGSFDFLFNICPPHNDVINPPNLPGGFSLASPGHSETRPMRPLSHKTCFFPATVTTTESGEYICEGSEGAILEIPEGAIQDEAINRGLFAGLAKLQGVQWYKYTVTQGRDISNGSLYLVTSFSKCNQWGIAVFNRRCHPGQGLTFVTNPLGWKGSRAFPTKVADPNQWDTPNQCVFLRGYKIMIRQDIFDNLCNDQPSGSNPETPSPSSSVQAGSSSLTLTRQRATRIRGGGGTDPMSRMLAGGTPPPPTRTTVPDMKKSDGVSLDNTRMPTYQRMQRDLSGIPSGSFPIWGEVLGYERGLRPAPLPEISEEGVLIPTAEGFTYQRMPAMSARNQLSPTRQVESQLSSAGQVELEDCFHLHPMTLLPSTNENEMGSPYYHSQTPWASTDSTSDQPAMLTSQTDRRLYAGAYNQRLHNHIGRLRLGNLEWEEHDQPVENTRRLSDEVILHANFNSSPVHPSDLINVTLLSEYPDAKVALTHDDVWCDLLRDNFPKLNYATLRSIARSYTTVDEYGCVTLEKDIRTSVTSMSTDRQMVKEELSDGVMYRVQHVQSELRDIPPRFFPSGGDGGPSSQQLHNYVGRHHLGNLEWEEHDQPVENYGHLWTAGVQINGTTFGVGQGSTKGEARDQAAHRALDSLHQL